LLFVAITPMAGRRARGARRSRSRLWIDLKNDFAMRDLPVARHAGRSAGIWTPGAAMGHKLIKRLVDHAGLTFAVEK